MTGYTFIEFKHALEKLDAQTMHFFEKLKSTSGEDNS